MHDPDFRYPVKGPIRVIDGDTVEVILDRGFGDLKKVSLRINGVDAPESRTRKNLLEREAGKLITEVVIRWVLQNENLMFFASSEEKPKYAGRIVGSLLAGGPAGWSLADFLIENGLARPYRGGKRVPWTDRKLKAILKEGRTYLDETPDRRLTDEEVLDQ